MSNKLKRVDPVLERMATEVFLAEKEISLGKNIKENEAKIENIMSDTPFDQLYELAMLIEDKAQHDPVLKGNVIPF